MTHEKTHEPLAIRASFGDGYIRHTYRIVPGKNMQSIRESDLKLRHISDNMAQFLKVP